MKLSIALLLAAVLAPACAAPRATALTFEDREQIEVRQDRTSLQATRQEPWLKRAVAAHDAR